MDSQDLTKLSFNAAPRAITALHMAADRGGLSRTDAANRALQVYAVLISGSWWRAIQIVFQERAQLRKFAADPGSDVRPRPTKPVHFIAGGSTTTSCCGKTPGELPHADHRLTGDPWAVTCDVERATETPRSCRDAT